MTKESILFIHALIGATVFITGFLQIILKKGGNLHKIIGKIYMYGWLLLLLSGAYLGGLFMTIIGVFGYYFALTGARIGQLKNKAVTLFDKIVYLLSSLIAISMIFYSVVLFLKDQISFSIIFAVFGGIFLFTTIKDVYKYVFNKPLVKQVYGKLDWYFEHFKRMCISFIAAVTAFTSIQNLFKNNTANFLVPTLIGSILIYFAVKMYKKKLIK